MRTTEGARYARWAAAVAVGLTLIVAAVYLRRTWHEERVRRDAPPPVPETVQQRSAEFSFSKVEQDRTLFTVRASSATEFKDQNRSLLEDVWITIYGREGNRYDNIHTRECNYEPATGHIICQGDVQIDLESSVEAKSAPGQRAIHVETKNISFDRQTGEVKSEAPVEFRFPYGEGQGVGATYSTSEARIRLEHDVELKLAQPSGSTIPAVFTGSSLEYRRNEHTMRLFGPVVARQGERELSAGNLTLELDAELRARRAVASGKPEMRSADPKGRSSVTADEFIAFFNPQGWVERIFAEGDVHGDRAGPAGQDTFAAQRVGIEMEPRANEPRLLTATGDVKASMRSSTPAPSAASSTLGAGAWRQIEAPAMRLEFVAGAKARERRVEGAETLGPGVIETKSAEEDTRIRAARFTAKFDSQGRLQRLLGHSGVQIDRKLTSGAPQTSTADELAVSLSAGGDWATLDESGKVRFRQADRTAQADRAHIVRATDMVTLEGSPVVTDNASRTTAAAMEINQRTGDVHATGGVRTSYFSAQGNGATNFGPEPAHITSQVLTGNSTTGHAVYSGGARLWQGDAVIEADTIELWRGEQRMEARGNVVALVPQAPDARHQASRPTIWHVQAPHLQYFSAEGRAQLDGGVTAESDQGNLLSRTLDLYLSPSPQGEKGSRQLTRAVALGGVVVEQGGRRGTAQRGDYTAAEGKFVLSGGQPTLTDASHDTTTGRELTFFVSSDTILVSSETGLRTLTKHRIEK